MVMNKEIQIYIDIIDNNTIQGWYINPTDPVNKKLLLYLDGQFKSVTIANMERQDVADTYGQLESGFSFDIKNFPVFHNIEIRKENNEVLLSQEHIPQEGIMLKDRASQGSHYLQEYYERLESISIDLSRPINGVNWYNADVDASGRWGGPKLESALKIPALAVGDYLLQLDIGSACCDLGAMEVTFNDIPVTFINTQYDTPVILEAEVIAEKECPFWHIVFKYPETREPETSIDQRKLGIFLKTVVLTKISTSK